MGEQVRGKLALKKPGNKKKLKKGKRKLVERSLLNMWLGLYPRNTSSR